MAEVAAVIRVVVLCGVRLGWHGAIRVELMRGCLLMRMRFPRHIPGAFCAGAEHGENQEMAYNGSHVTVRLAQWATVEQRGGEVSGFLLAMASALA